MIWISAVRITRGEVCGNAQCSWGRYAMWGMRWTGGENHVTDGGHWWSRVSKKLFVDERWEADMNVTRLVSFLLTGLCINYDVVQVARNTSIVKRGELICPDTVLHPSWSVQAISMPNHPFIGNTQMDIHASMLYPWAMDVHSSIFRQWVFLSAWILPWTLHGYFNPEARLTMQHGN